MSEILQKTCLTNLSHAGGCGCKLDPASLQELLIHLPGKSQENVVVGFETADDCAVYEYSDKDYLLFTTDFFTPLVDDPFTYGSLAAANALSDVFAKGGKPLIANVILGFPQDKMSKETVREIMKGGQKVLDEAGCLIVGGHTIINPQPIYGFSIIGRVEKENLKRNSTAQEGDLLLLTKPIGSGVLSNAMKLGLLEESAYDKLVSYLIEVNSCGRKLGKIPSVHAMTDLTGFGLVGHGLEMAEGAGLSLEISAEKVALFDGVKDLSLAVFSPQSGSVKNYNHYQHRVTFEGTWSNEDKYIFCDPQSNGGLLIAVSHEGLEQVQAILKTCIGREAMVIGSFHEKKKSSAQVIVHNS